MAKTELGIFLTQQGFFAGKKLENGTLALGAHKISEDEILTMASTLLRTYQAKTGEDTLIVPATEDRLMVMKLMEIKKGQEAPTEQPAAVTPKKTRSKKAKPASKREA